MHTAHQVDLIDVNAGHQVFGDAEGAQTALDGLSHRLHCLLHLKKI